MGTDDQIQDTAPPPAAQEQTATESVAGSTAGAKASDVAPSASSQADVSGPGAGASSSTQKLWELASSEQQPEEQAVVEAIRAEGCDVTWQNQETGESVMCRAAAQGHLDMVLKLLEAGAPWNAVDKRNRCAGQYALEKGHQTVVDALVNAGVRAEMILGQMMNTKVENRSAANADYLKSDVEYTDDNQKLMDPNGDAVMMEWERPLMQIHAQVLCHGGLQGTADPKDRHIMNVGFGMGIIDGYIQEMGAGKHTIIEAHPQVYKRMIAQGWDKKPGVTILFGRWQDMIDQVEDASLDGVFFDTFGEYYAEMQAFHEHLPRIVRKGGIYSFFNGLCPRNIFFHGVACQVAQLELSRLGFDCEFHGCEIQSDANADGTWEGVRERYWWNDTYYLPVAPKRDQA